MTEAIKELQKERDLLERLRKKHIRDGNLDHAGWLNGQVIGFDKSIEIIKKTGE